MDLILSSRYVGSSCEKFHSDVAGRNQFHGETMPTKREVTDRIQKRIQNLKARVAELQGEIGAMPYVPEDTEIVPIEIILEANVSARG